MALKSSRSPAPMTYSCQLLVTSTCVTQLNFPKHALSPLVTTQVEDTIFHSPFPCSLSVNPTALSQGACISFFV